MKSLPIDFPDDFGDAFLRGLLFPAALVAIAVGLLGAAEALIQLLINFGSSALDLAAGVSAPAEPGLSYGYDALLGGAVSLGFGGVRLAVEQLLLAGALSMVWQGVGRRAPKASELLGGSSRWASLVGFELLCLPLTLGLTAPLRLAAIAGVLTASEATTVGTPFGAFTVGPLFDGPATTTLLYVAVAGLLFLLFFLGSVWCRAALCLTPWYIVVGGLGLREALSRSLAATAGWRIQIAFSWVAVSFALYFGASLFGLVLAFIPFIGPFLLGIGSKLLQLLCAFWFFGNLYRFLNPAPVDTTSPSTAGLA